MYRFIGSEAEITGVATLRTFGALIHLEDEAAKELISGNVAIVPESDFDAAGFTAAEMNAYSNPGSHGDAKPEFLAKKQALIMRLFELREPVASGQFPISAGGK